MDALEQYLSGGKPQQQPGSSVITEQLLDSLKRVESDKDRFALNKTTKAMGAYQFMPETVQMLHKQGIEFNPFNEKEARQAARTYLGQLVERNQGDVNKALAQYGGFITKDPTAYVNKVTQGATQTTQPVAQTVAQPTSSDPLENYLSGKPAAPAAAPISEAGAGRGSYAGYNPQEATQGVTAQPKIKGIAANILQTGQQMREQLPGFLASTADVVAGAPAAVAGLVGYGAGRAFGLSPEEATKASQKVAGQMATPVGRVTGLAETQGYKQALPTQIMEKVGQYVGESAESISQKTGIPIQDVEAAINASLMAAGVAAPKLVGAYKKAAAELGTAKPTVAQQMQAQFEAAQGKARSVGAAKVEVNPYANQITGEEAVRGQYPQVKLSKTPENVPVTEQTTRSQIAQEILGENQPVRSGVITGNENTLRNEYTKAKMPNPTPESELLKKQIANEQVALSNYAQKRIDNTGASPNLVNPYERGERINSFYAGDEGLTGFFKGEKQKFYNEVTDKVGNNPIQTNNVNNLLADKQFKAGLGLRGNESVARAAEDLINHARTIGFKDEFGNVYAPNTVGAWTAVQKSLNSNWTKDNAAIIRQINQAIERDIGAAGGLDLLKKADQLHQAEKVLFGSKGIKQIFGEIDPNGVQTAVAYEAIPQKLNSMPTDQWKHIYDTAEKLSKGVLEGPIDKATGQPKWSIPVPDELRIAAESAKNEMKGNIAREVYEAGAGKAGEWNQNSVNKILNARSEKIKHAFPLEEQQAFHKLNYGGYLMPGVHGYEGAGLQVKRVQGIVESNLERGGAATGATIGGTIAGPAGAAVGGYLGGKAGARAAEKLGEKALMKQAQKTQEEMQRNAQMGKNKASDMLNQK